MEGFEVSKSGAHSDRAVVSRILSAWEKRGLIEKADGVYRYGARLTEALDAGNLEP